MTEWTEVPSANDYLKEGEKRLNEIFNYEGIKMTKMTEWTEEVARKILDAIPEAKAVAVNSSGHTHWFFVIPEIIDTIPQPYWYAGFNYDHGHYLGKFPCPDWTKSLYVKKYEPQAHDLLYRIDFDDFTVREYAWNDAPFCTWAYEHGLLLQTKEEAQEKLDKILEVLCD